MEYRRGSVEELEGKCARLMLAHAAEVGMLGEDDFLPKTQVYRALEEQGSLKVYLAESGGVIVGYQIFHVGAHPHYAGVTIASTDGIYVSPAHRGYEAVRFLAWADERLKEAGAAYVIRGASSKKPLERLFLRLGYAEHERSYIRSL